MLKFRCKKNNASVCVKDSTIIIEYFGWLTVTKINTSIQSIKQRYE